MLLNFRNKQTFASKIVMVTSHSKLTNFYEFLNQRSWVLDLWNKQSPVKQSALSAVLNTRRRCDFYTFGAVYKCYDVHSLLTYLLTAEIMAAKTTFSFCCYNYNYKYNA